MSKYLDQKYINLISFRLRNFKQKKESVYNFSCPYCLDSKKSSLKARFYIYEKDGILKGKCHNCGISVSVETLVKHIDPSLHEDYVFEKYKERTDWTTPKKKKDPPKIAPVKFAKIDRKVLLEAEYCDTISKEHYCYGYLQSRLIPKKFYKNLLYTSNYKLFIESNFPEVQIPEGMIGDRRLVIPFFNEYDEFIAVTGRAMETSSRALRYVTFRLKDHREKVIFGMDRVNLNKQVKIVEGPIDSLFLSNCVASGDANLEMVAKDINKQDTILVYDNERRNKEIVRMMEHSLKNGYNVVIWPDIIYEKDINQMVESGIPISEIESIIHNNTFTGIKGIFNLNLWKRV